MYYGNISNIILDPFHAYLSKLCRIKYSYLIFRLIIYILKKVRTIFPLAQDNIITYTFTENKPICKIISVNLFFSLLLQQIEIMNRNVVSFLEGMQHSIDLNSA